LRRPQPELVTVPDDKLVAVVQLRKSAREHRAPSAPGVQGVVVREELPAAGALERAQLQVVVIAAIGDQAVADAHGAIPSEARAALEDLKSCAILCRAMTRAAMRTREGQHERQEHRT
jgi:hypothetical protein